MDHLTTVCQKRRNCTKVCGIIMPKGHGACQAIVPAQTTHHFFVSMISLAMHHRREDCEPQLKYTSSFSENQHASQIQSAKKSATNNP